MPKISVIVPTYNVEPYIEKCLISFEKQDYEDFDVYIIDDGSPANEYQLVKPFLEKDPLKFHYLRKDNGGYGSVLEYAFNHIESPYLLICDPDDWLTYDALSTLATTLVETNADIICGARYLSYSDTPQVMYDKMFSSTFVNLKENHIYQKGDKDFSDVYLIENAPHAKLFKRSLLKNVKFPNKISNTDALLFYVALFNAQKVVYLSKPLAFYLINRFGNTVTDIKPKSINEMIEVHQRILDEAKKFKNLESSFYFQMFMAFYYICDRTDSIHGENDVVLTKLKETSVLLYQLSKVRKDIHHFYHQLSTFDNLVNIKYELMLNPLINRVTTYFWFKERLNRRQKVDFIQEPDDTISISYKYDISIIVPVYNVEKYLAKCLDSLVNQTLKSIEILVVNDGTKDNSQIIIDDYAKKYPNLVFGLIKVNGGLSDARNFGYEHSSGKYVAFIDSDDWVDITMFEKMFNKAESTQSDIVVCDMTYVYDNGTSEKSSGGDFSIADVKENPDIISINNSACNKIYRRELFDEIRFEKGIWYEDLATIPKLISISKRIAKVNEPLYMYYQRWNSIVHTQNPKVFDIYVALKSVKNFLIKQNTYQRYKRFINKMTIVHCADLTTVRIKDFDSQRIKYLELNVKYLNEFYPHWIFDRNVWSSTNKKKIVFILNRLHLFKLLLWLFDRKGK